MSARAAARSSGIAGRLPRLAPFFLAMRRFDGRRRCAYSDPNEKIVEINEVTSFEQAFGDAENAAEAARKSASQVVSQAKALTKAAQSGNIAAIKRGQEKLKEALAELEQEVSNASACWPFTDEEEKRKFDDGYAAELQNAADGIGLKIYERDGLLISYPSIVRTLSADCAVRVDRKKVSTIRPSYLADFLLKNQNKSSGFPPERFLETLHAVYKEVVSEGASGLAQGSGGRVVPLARIYRLITALPGGSREYDRADFARDLYKLDSEGIDRTKSGAAVSFPSSTGTRRRSSDLFSFVGPDGNNVEYYGIRFSENDA